MFENYFHYIFDDQPKLIYCRYLRIHVWIIKKLYKLESSAQTC